jgi:hypothetical protein
MNRKDRGERLRDKESLRGQTDRAARAEKNNKRRKEKRELFSHAFKRRRFNLCKFVNLSKFWQ